MPPEHEGALFIKDEVEVIRQWIAMGANAPKDEKPEPDPKEHWAYQPIAVSYTHLRAHETKANLVCRLLLEKKK